MSLFAVSRQGGPAWRSGKSAFEQPGANEHARFMDGLAQQGCVLLAGPLAGTEAGHIRVLLIAEAAGGAQLERRLGDDPWEIAHQIETISVEPWTLFVGAERLAHSEV